MIPPNFPSNFSLYFQNVDDTTEGNLEEESPSNPSSSDEDLKYSLDENVENRPPKRYGNFTSDQEGPTKKIKISDFHINFKNIPFSCSINLEISLQKLVDEIINPKDQGFIIKLLDLAPHLANFPLEYKKENLYAGLTPLSVAIINRNWGSANLIANALNHRNWLIPKNNVEHLKTFLIYLALNENWAKFHYLCACFSELKSKDIDTNCIKSLIQELKISPEKAEKVLVELIKRNVSLDAPLPEETTERCLYLNLLDEMAIDSAKIYTQKEEKSNLFFWCLKKEMPFWENALRHNKKNFLNYLPPSIALGCILKFIPYENDKTSQALPYILKGFFPDTKFNDTTFFYFAIVNTLFDVEKSYLNIKDLNKFEHTCLQNGFIVKAAKHKEWELVLIFLKKFSTTISKEVIVKVLFYAMDADEMYVSSLCILVNESIKGISQSQKEKTTHLIQGVFQVARNQSFLENEKDLLQNHFAISLPHFNFNHFVTSLCYSAAEEGFWDAFNEIFNLYPDINLAPRGHHCPPLLSAVLHDKWDIFDKIASQYPEAPLDEPSWQGSALYCASRREYWTQVEQILISTPNVRINYMDNDATPLSYALNALAMDHENLQKRKENSFLADQQAVDRIEQIEKIATLMIFLGAKNDYYLNGHIIDVKTLKIFSTQITNKINSYMHSKESNMHKECNKLVEALELSQTKNSLRNYKMANKINNSIRMDLTNHFTKIMNALFRGDEFADFPYEIKKQIAILSLKATFPFLSPFTIELEEKCIKYFKILQSLRDAEIEKLAEACVENLRKKNSKLGIATEEIDVFDKVAAYYLKSSLKTFALTKEQECILIDNFAQLNSYEKTPKLTPALLRRQCSLALQALQQPDNAIQEGINEIDNILTTEH